MAGKLQFWVILLITIGVSGCVSGKCYTDRTTPGQPSEQVIAASEDADGFDEFDEFSEADMAAAFDPLEGYNRVMFEVNDTLYIWVLRPVSHGYRFAVPEPARVSIKSCYTNLLFPMRFVNNILQLKFKASGIELARFGINSTIGLVGLFDPATSWFALEASEEDFGQTLASYGVGEGFPFVIPILGPSNLRDALCMIPDSFLNPVSYVRPIPHSIGIQTGEKINKVSLYSDEYDELKRTAVDPYVFFRDAYKQNRDKKVEK